MSAPTLVVVGRGWTPEEAARHEVALYSALASNKQALRVYLQKVRVVETVRAGRQQQMAPLPEGNAKPRAQPSTGAGRRSSGPPGQPLAADTEPRARRQKSEAQQLKSVKKLQHKWLKRRCEAAAAKAGGSPPRVLARVLACCGRFFELLLPEGAERMQRLRQEAAATTPKPMEDAMDSEGLDAMRAALAATEAEAEAAELPTSSLRLADKGPPPAISGRVAGLAKREAKTKVAMDLGRTGLCPGDPQWHGAGSCRWVTPPGASDESSEHWPALEELPRGRGRRP